MILYTMMPQELVFQAESTEFSKQKMVTYNNIPLLVELSDDNQYRILRVLSSDPSHYLDSRYSPGEKISIT